MDSFEEKRCQHIFINGPRHGQQCDSKAMRKTGIKCYKHAKYNYDSSKAISDDYHFDMIQLNMNRISKSLKKVQIEAQSLYEKGTLGKAQQEKLAMILAFRIEPNEKSKDAIL